jgi:hypothetical protein
MYMLVCVLNIPPNFDEVMKVNARALTISTFPAAGGSGTCRGGGVYVG